MSARTATVLVAFLYVLHRNIWFWREARPLVFGVLPIGLFYHVAFTVASSVVIWLLVKSAWPTRLDDVENGVGPAVFLLSLFGTNMTAFSILGASGHAFANGVVTFGLMASSRRCGSPRYLAQP